MIDNGMGLSRTAWAMSMFGLGMALSKSSYPIVAQSISYPYPSGAMNIATADFLATDADMMLMIDTDIIFTPQQVAMLLSHDVPFVAGVYAKRKLELEWNVVPLGDSNPFAPQASPRLVEVARVAKGFALMQRSLFTETLKDEKRIWELLPECEHGSSEDFYFCDKIRARGVKVMIDPRCIVKHEGSAVYPIGR